MITMNLLNVPDDRIAFKNEHETAYDFKLTVFRDGDNVKFGVGKSVTSWMDLQDGFIERIQFDRLNPCFLEMHLSKEIEIRNCLDEGIRFLRDERYQKAIEYFGDVLYYDPEYGEALFFKSKALFGQGHFVKSLRTYKKAIRADARIEDGEYHMLLLRKSSEERDSFPKIKRNIYAGDEHFAKGEFEKALESYDRALANPTKFKNRILSKLLNKKATALMRLDMFGDAVSVFSESVKAKPNDYAYFYLGLLDYDLHSETFRNHLNITKRQILMKAEKLDEVGEYDLALECLDEFLDNHYRVDEDYRKALNLKVMTLKHLGRDASDAESLLAELFG